MVFGEYFPIANDTRRVVELALRSAWITQNDIDIFHRVTDTRKLAIYPPHQFGTQQQILRRIARQGQLRENDCIGPLFVPGATGGFDNPVRVTGNIADQQVDLR